MKNFVKVFKSLFSRITCPTKVTTEQLLEQARKRYESMSDAEKEAMLETQAKSWARSCIRGDMSDEEWRRWS